MSKQMNERKETNQINIMKSEIIMKNYNRKKNNKKEQNQLFGMEIIQGSWFIF